TDSRSIFIGMNSSHKKKDFVRAVVEGITFSLNESISIFRDKGENIDTMISIGGGAKSEEWLKIQADIFDAKIIKLSNEQGPGLGAAMLAAYGCNWFSTLKECADSFLKEEKIFFPNKENVKKYKELYTIYKDIFHKTIELNKKLNKFRN